LAYKNWVEYSGSTLTTSETEQGERVVSNLKTRESDDVWRVDVTSDTAASVEVDFGEDRAVDVVTHQFPRGDYPGVSEEDPAYNSADTIQYLLKDAADVTLWDSGASASGLVTGYMTHWKRPSSTITARKLVVNYVATNRVTAGFFDVGNIGAWPIIEPSVGIAYPAGFGWDANNGIKETTAGKRYTARFDPLRRWSFIFDALSNDESMELDEMIRYSGGARQIFARRGDLPSGKDAMHCLVQSAREIESATPEIRGLSMALKEFI